MKLHLPLVLLSTLLASMASAATYLAEGVDRGDLVHSERFYDTGKGFYFSYTSCQPYRGAKALYEEMRNYNFLGLWKPRVSNSSGFSASSFSKMTDDADTCGYQVPENLIQYWLSYYGVFYKGTKALPYGYAYDREYLDDLGGTLSLSLSPLFYDTWKNQGNNLSKTAGWFFAGGEYGGMRTSATDEGGYFSDYFTDGDSASAYLYDVNTLTGLKHSLCTALGYQPDAQGNLSRKEVGQIAYLGLDGTSSGSGHAITCYGFETNADGSLCALYCTNSDDWAYDLFTLYVREKKGAVYLYTDAACTKAWTYAGSSWCIDAISYINTPEELRRLYAEYHAADNPLVWNGCGNKGWSTAYDRATADALPDSSTGWNVRAQDGLFHSYYETGRPVLFDDSAASGAVSVSGTLQVPRMILGNSTLDYTFTGSGAAIEAPLSVQGVGCAGFTGVSLTTEALRYAGYSLRFGQGSTLRADAGALGSRAVLELDGGNAVFSSSLTLGSGAILSVASPSSLQASSLILQNGSALDFSLSPGRPASTLLTYTGSLSLSGTVDVLINGSGLVNGTQYRLMSFGSGSDLVSHLSCFCGTLSVNGNVLYLTYTAMPEATWNGDGSTWSASAWSGRSMDTAGAALSFTEEGSGTVNISGEVNAYSVAVSGGAYTFRGGAGASVNAAQDMTLSGSASLTSSVALNARHTELRDTASLALAAAGVIRSLDTAKGTTLTLSKGAYTLNDSLALDGNLVLQDTSSLTLNLTHSLTIGGLLTTAAGTALNFAGGNASVPVTYTVREGLGGVSGSVSVGGGAGDVVLHIDGNLSKAVTLKSGGVLELGGKGTCSAAVTGSGTLRVDSGAEQSFSLTDSATGLADTLHLVVDGTATIGTESEPLAASLPNDITVRGHLNVVYSYPYGAEAAYTIGTLHTDGGVVDIQGAGDLSETARINIGTLSVGAGGGTLQRPQLLNRYVSNPYRSLTGHVSIATLTGSGDVLLTSDGWLSTTLFSIASVDHYTGHLTVRNEASQSSSRMFNLVAAELGNSVVPGGVSLVSQAWSGFDCRVGLGLTGSATLGGLDSSGEGNFLLYSGRLAGGDFAQSSYDQEAKRPLTDFVTDVATRTLTIDCEGMHEFTGAVGSSLLLVKKGAGSQSFSGDLSAFDGSIAVQGGTLVFSEALNTAGVTMEQGTTLRSAAALTAPSLTLRGGALQAADVVSSAMVLSGCNTMQVKSLNVSGNTALTLVDANVDTAILSLRQAGGSGSLSLPQLTVTYDPGETYKTTYCLLEYSSDFGGALQGLTLTRNGQAVDIGSKDEAEAYFRTSTVGGKTVYTLMMRTPDGERLLPRLTATTLTWCGGSGAWAVEQGFKDRAWSGTVDNTNFYDGDTVRFTTGGATITLDSAVAPALCEVTHSSGSLTFAGSGSLAGAAILRKSGAGSLTLATANSYAGGTELSGGSLTVGHADALGTGAVTMLGGALSLGNYAVANAITATGGSLSGTAYAGALTVNGAVSLGSLFTAGRLTLVGGTLSGGSISNTAVSAAGGTLASALTGSSSLTSSGSVSLSGNNTYTGGTRITGGTLTLRHAAALGSGGVTLSGGTLVLGSYAVTNAMTATGGSLSGTAYAGALAVMGNVSLCDSFTAGSVALSSGTLSGGSLCNTAVLATGGTLATALVGSSRLTVAGPVTLSGNNSYSGGATLSSGSLTLGSATALGQGSLSMSGGSLDMGHYALTNAVSATGGHLSGTAYAGTLSVNGEVSLGDSFHAGQILLAGGALSGGSISNTAVTASGGAISARLTGATSLSSSGTLNISGSNSHTGGTSISGGTLTLGHARALGAGPVSLSAGTLDMGTHAVDNDITATGGTISGTAYTGTLTVNGTVNLGSALSAERIIVQSGVVQGGSVRKGDVYLLGGQLATASVGGRVTVQGNSRISGPLQCEALDWESGTLQADLRTGDVGKLLYAGGSLVGDLTCNGGLVSLGTSPLSISGTLQLVSRTEWEMSAPPMNYGTYTLVEAGSISGDAAEMAFAHSGSGRMGYTITADEHRLLLHAVVRAIDITWTGGKGIWTVGTAFGNEVFYAGDDVHILLPSALTLRGQVCPGSLVVECAGTVSLVSDRKTPNSGLGGSASLTKNRIGTLTLNAGNTYSGGTVLNAGIIKATAADSFGTGGITVNGGTLNLGGKAVANDIVLCGTATLKGDAKYMGNVTVEGDAVLLAKISSKGMTTIGEGSSLTLAEKATMAGSITVAGGSLNITAPKGLTLAKGAMMLLDNGGTVSGLLTIGTGSTLVWADGSFETAAPVLKGGTVKLGGEGLLTLSGSKAQVQFGDKLVELPGRGVVYTDDHLIVNSGTVTLSSVSDGRSINIAGGTLKLATGKVYTDNDIVVSGNAAVANGKTHLGDITVNGTLAKGTNITIAADKTVELNGTGVMLGTIAGAGTVDVNASIDATAAKITAAHINLNSGTYTNTKGIKLAKGQTLTLGGVALKLGPTGALATAAGSTLAVSGGNTLSGNLTLGGGALVFEAGSLAVEGTLTLSKAMTVSGSGTITYTELKPFKGDIAALFGGAEVELDAESGTLTFNGGAEPRLRMVSVPLDAAPVALAMPAPAANPVADAMVQADWGIIDAERAFMGAVNSRHQHAALLDKGQGAAWVSAFGASVRHGNKGAHHGSDGNIEGAAFGLEHAVSETGSIGLAVGRSKNRIAATGVTHLRQETTHVALYGQKQLAHGFTADAAASYGDTETKLGAASWQQKSAALTARLTHAQQLTDATAFRTFGGLAYEATESGNILGAAHSGSVQSLRGELGAGITHTSGKAHLYAEAALTGDMVRHNPTADLGGFRTHGASPGRIGVRATIGGLYEFTDTWSGTASYGIEAESRSTSHTFNVGVSKTF